MSRKQRSVILGFAFLGAVTSLAAASRAHACGGFFCSQVPIDQAGEEIIFSVQDDHVTAHIMVAFTGNAKDFAWVVPVQTKPTIGLGRPEVFNALRSQTRPTWNVDFGSLGGQCGTFGRAEAGGLSPPQAASGGGVNVLESRDVGPYNTVILESRDAGELIAWLNANGYDQPPSSTPFIQHYVGQGMLFVALKLKQDASTGEIQPIVLDMDNAEACVPLILTRVAAVADMPVLTYALGPHRAFPANWFHVEINQKKLNWLDGGSNYRQLVTQALDEAGGRGFVTEYAGSSAFMKNQLYREGRFDLARLRSITDPAMFVQALLQMGFPRDSTMQSLLRKHIPMPASARDRGVVERDFYNNISAYRADLAGFTVDGAAFVADLEERIIEPLRKAQAMFDTQPYLTRLLSTVSPDEMTRDPLFVMNPNLPRVSNNHMAKATGECTADGSIKNITLTTENGGKVFIPGPYRRFTGDQTWGLAADEPAAARIELVGATGVPAVYSRAQAKLADQYLDRETPDAVRARVIPLSGQEHSGTLFGCAAAPGGRGPAALALVGLALALTCVSRSRRPRRG